MSHERRWGRLLLPGENLIHAFGVSRVYLCMFLLFPTVMMLIVGLLVLLSGEILGALFFVASIGLLLPTMFMWFFVHYAVTDHRVMSRVGILSKHSISVDLTTITDMFIQEPFWERLITKSGTIGINTAGGGKVELVLRHVSRPYTLKQDVYKHLQKALARSPQAGQGIVQR